MPCLPTRLLYCKFTRKPHLLFALVPKELRFVEKEQSILIIQSPGEAVKVHVLRVNITLEDRSLVLEPIQRIDCQSNSQRTRWELRSASGQIHIHKGGPAEGAIDECAAVPRDNKFRISRELSEPKRDFVVQQILLEPESHRVKSGDAFA